jgi:hypothetical protein
MIRENDTYPQRTCLGLSKDAEINALMLQHTTKAYSSCDSQAIDTPRCGSGASESVSCYVKIQLAGDM